MVQCAGVAEAERSPKIPQISGSRPRSATAVCRRLLSRWRVGAHLLPKPRAHRRRSPEVRGLVLRACEDLSDLNVDRCDTGQWWQWILKRSVRRCDDSNMITDIPTPLIGSSQYAATNPGARGTIRRRSVSSAARATSASSTFTEATMASTVPQGSYASGYRQASVPSAWSEQPSSGPQAAESFLAARGSRSRPRS
jgi:hypothetical protein